VRFIIFLRVEVICDRMMRWLLLNTEFESGLLYGQITVRGSRGIQFFKKSGGVLVFSLSRDCTYQRHSY